MGAPPGHGHRGYVALGQVINKRRDELRLSKSEVCRRAGVSQTTWRLIEKGGHETFTNTTLSRIAEALDLPAQRLFAMVGRKADEEAVNAMDAWEPSSHWEVKVEPLRGIWVTVAGDRQEDVERIVTMLMALNDKDEITAV